ncbi:MAG: glycosyltransferase family 4 protein [Verrucomicrobia bacterium]|nr:glycosyltransferase family 4 protein [Verrucomicrobiota bacterium]
MRILYITPVPPSPRHSGTGIRLFNTLHALASCGQVTLLTLASNRHQALVEDCRPWCRDLVTVDADTELRGLYAPLRRTSVWEDCWAAISTLDPVRVRNRNASELARLARLLGVEAFDLVWISKGWVAGLLPFLDWRKVVVDLDDLEHRVQWRMLSVTPWYPTIMFKYVELWKHRLLERRLCRRAARVLVCSEGDREILGYNKLRVLPNCVDISKGAPGGGPENPYRLLFVGNFKYPPNVDAALFFCELVLPQIRKVEPRAHVYIVGREPPEEIQALHNGFDVVVTGTVVEVTPYFEECGVVIVPLRVGGGTRVKILEAFANRKAVVSTSIGAEGLQVEDGIHLYLADDPANFASRCLTLMRDPSARRTLGEAGRRLVETRYNLSIFHQTICQVVSGVTRSDSLQPICAMPGEAI